MFWFIAGWAFIGVGDYMEVGNRVSRAAEVEFGWGLRCQECHVRRVVRSHVKFDELVA